MHTNQDNTLILECQAGNKQAFGKLYEQFVRPIYNFIYYKTHHKETAEDLVSQTFIKAFDRIQQYDINKGPFSAWLYQIARNTIVDHYRAARPTMDIEDVWDLGGDEDLERDLDMKTQLEAVQEYLKDLSAEQREIVIMRVWQEMSYEEIALALGKTEASCKMMFSRTMKKLRETMPTATWVLFLVAGTLISK